MEYHVIFSHDCFTSLLHFFGLAATPSNCGKQLIPNNLLLLWWPMPITDLLLLICTGRSGFTRSGEGGEIAFLFVLFAGKVVEPEQVPPGKKRILIFVGKTMSLLPKWWTGFSGYVFVFVDLTIIEIFQCMNKK